MDQELCEYCQEEPAVFVDYRGVDVVSKYHLCAACAMMTDEEFFGIEQPDA